MSISHLDMFYETRFSLHVSDSHPSSSPNTELTETPESAEIRYNNGVVREVNPDTFAAPDGSRGYEAAKFFIGRAMLDPDATVIPT